MNPNITTPKNIAIKMSKVKDRILKAARDKVIHKETLIMLLTNFSAETLKA